MSQASRIITTAIWIFVMSPVSLFASRCEASSVATIPVISGTSTNGATVSHSPANANVSEVMAAVATAAPTAIPPNIPMTTRSKNDIDVNPAMLFVALKKREAID